MDNALHESLALELHMEECALANLCKDQRSGDKLDHLHENIRRAEARIAGLRAQLAG